MTLHAQSVVALICFNCEADLRGQPKVQVGEVFYCASCALAKERRDAERRQRGPGGNPA